MTVGDATDCGDGDGAEQHDIASVMPLDVSIVDGCIFFLEEVVVPGFAPGTMGMSVPKYSAASVHSNRKNAHHAFW